MKTKKPRYRHGMHKSREYNSWAMMKSRCSNPKNPVYHHYGGRGISFCDRWEKFENFFADMGERPAKTSLDRIDNEKGYSKENCRWATKIEQANNCRDSVRISGMTVKEVESKTGVPASTISKRKRAGWPDERILFTPSRKCGFGSRSQEAGHR